MKIAIVGYGRMGKQIEKVLKEQSVSYITIDLHNPEAQFNTLNSQTLQNIDVVIDFTTPEVVLSNIEIYLAAKVNVVMATTGWYDHLEGVKKKIGQHIGFIWSGNFSLGVNLFFRIIKKSAEMFNYFDQYQPAVLELHHQGKKDSPSGTASMINNILLECLDNKNKGQFEKLDRQIEQNEIHVASVRGGYFPGTHAVYFDSPVDTIEIKHTARSREGFAVGAVAAAAWIKDRQGFFHINDFLDSLFTKKNTK
ncbi:MAG: 4-hydroxy-tetrahydrodipicolinate reductase [Spirochaetes bacterium]|nr:4-hydroxy-tetrahydrodipicolinate reductase [Spirochaetota bacterium]